METRRIVMDLIADYIEVGCLYNRLRKLHEQVTKERLHPTDIDKSVLQETIADKKCPYKGNGYWILVYIILCAIFDGLLIKYVPDSAARPAFNTILISWLLGILLFIYVNIVSDKRKNWIKAQEGKRSRLEQQKADVSKQLKWKCEFEAVNPWIDEELDKSYKYWMNLRRCSLA